MDISRVIKSDTGIEVMIYNSSAGGQAPVHGAYLANQKGFKWVPWSWNAKGESFPLRVHSLDITQAIAAEEVVVNAIQVNEEKGEEQVIIA